MPSSPFPADPAPDPRAEDGTTARPPLETPAPPPLTRSRTIARTRDDLVRIPGTKWRVGLDPLLGLIPGTGDWIGWAVSFHLMVAAAQLGAGSALLVRMFGNIMVDVLTGVFPFVGDLFDAGWKANSRNLELLEAHFADPDRTARVSKWRVGAVLVGAALILIGAAWALFWVFRQVLGFIF